MNQLILLTSIFLIFQTSVFAQNKSVLGIDYLKKTKNPIIAEAMLEMELALIKHYSKGKWAKATKKQRIYALSVTASTLGYDKVSKKTYELLIDIAPDTPLIFLKLDKSKYPNLWDFGELIRLKKITQEEKALYKLLHGKEWKEEPEK